MRYEKGHKEATRQKIVEVAAAEFRRNGIEGIGVADLMAKAGLTHGGFYSHFKSKEELVQAAMEEASKKSQFQESVSVLQPPSVGPSVGARLLSRPRTAGTIARFLPVNIAKPVAKTVGIIAPPMKPGMARAAIIELMSHAKPQTTLEIVKPAAETVKSQRVENARESQTERGIMTISPIR